MTAKAKPKNWYIKLIHIAKHQLQMDDDSYRANLQALVRKDSCSDMTIPELVQVLELMKKQGFKAVSKKSNGYSPRSAHKKEKDLLDKLRQQWISMAHTGVVRDGSEQALSNWALGIAKKKRLNVHSLEWLPDSLLISLIERLKQWEARS